MTLFLLEYGIPKDIYNSGYNALDLALLDLKYDSKKLKFVEILIRHGYVFELSHNQIIAEMKLVSPSIYQALLKMYPALG